MKLIASLLFISLLCATDFTRSKAFYQDEKQQKGTHVKSPSVIEDDSNDTNDQAAQKSLVLKLGKAKKLLGETVQLAGSLAEKNQFLQPFQLHPLALKHGIEWLSLFNNQVIRIGDNTVIFWDETVNSPIKVLKKFEPKTSLAITDSKVSEMTNSRYFKLAGLPNGIQVAFNSMYYNLKLEKGHVLSAKLSSESLETLMASFMYFNCVPMFWVVNHVNYGEMERKLEKFNYDAALAGDTVFLQISTSLKTSFGGLKGQDMVYQDLRWLGDPLNRDKRIAIPRSLSVMALRVSPYGNVNKLFAWVGNNEENPESLFINKFELLKDYYKMDGDTVSTNILDKLQVIGL